VHFVSVFASSSDFFFILVKVTRGKEDREDGSLLFGPRLCWVLGDWADLLRAAVQVASSVSSSLDWGKPSNTALSLAVSL
jgi:hypothetical protein